MVVRAGVGRNLARDRLTRRGACAKAWCRLATRRADYLVPMRMIPQLLSRPNAAYWDRTVPGPT